MDGRVKPYLLALAQAGALGLGLLLTPLGAGAASGPTHAALLAADRAGQLPPLVPVRRFVADTDYAGGHIVSPNGQRLLWETVVGLDAGLAVAPATTAQKPTTASADSERLTWASGRLSRPGSAGPTYAWLADSRHVVALKDPTGDENTSLWVWDTQAPPGDAPWNVTPWPRTRSVFVSRAAGQGGTFLFASNRRDRATLDLYEADTATRTIKEMARSDGQVLGWLVDQQRRLAGRVRQRGTTDGSGTDIELLQADGSWRVVKTIDAFDNYWIHRLDTARGLWWASSNVGRDTTALLEVELSTGAEQVLASHEALDMGPVYLGPSGAPVGYAVEPGYPQVTLLDPALASDLARAGEQAHALGLVHAKPRLVRPQSWPEQGPYLIVRAVSDFDSAELLLDRTTGALRRLNPDTHAEALAALAPEQPFSFRASDGLTIHGYLIKPVGLTPAHGPVPLVVEIHGGPWARDGWSPAGFRPRQMLVNRGYAVMTVNYRGSTGYGRRFLWAGQHEYFGRMQQDVAEAVQWAIDQQIADPKAIAVLGGSFGGFSVLAQLIQQRHDYRCGIDLVGVAHWPRVVENWPPFWRNRHWFNRFFGDVGQPDERARMLAQSPISHLERITAPLLVIHGANDVRVLKQDSDDVVSTLKALGRPVDYLVFDNEGHSIRQWRNRLALWRKVEDTLATCLGGRTNGFDLYELMPR